MLKGFEFESFPSLEYVLVCFFVSKSTFSGKKEKLFFFRSVRFFYAYCSVFFFVFDSLYLVFEGVVSQV